MSEAAPLVELEGVEHRYAAVEAAAGPAVLRGVDLRVEAGESLAVVGPSGCGKSTLLNVIGTLQRPTAGRVRFEGRDLAELDADALAALRNGSIGFVFQSHHLLPQCSALENVLVPTLVRKGASAEARAKKLLARVGLGERVAHRPAELSGGECQRVAVVRALINEPRLLLADEPTGSLDEESADELSDLLAELNRDEGVALVCVTHSQRLAERMGRVLSLRNGVLA